MVGQALAQSLTQQGTDWRQLVRRPSSSPHQIPWNPTSSIGQATDLNDFSVVVHLSGANVAGRRWTPAYKQEMRASRVASTHALASALAGLDRKPHTLLCASAVGIYGDRGEELLTEASEPGTGYFPNLCSEWESAAAPALQAGIRVVHLRFGVILDPGSGALGKMLPPFLLGLGAQIGNGRQWFPWITLHDVVRAIEFAAQTPTLNGPVNTVAPNPVTNAEFTRQLAYAIHRPALFVAPAFVMRLAFGEMAKEGLLASTRVMPEKLLQAGFQFDHPTLKAAFKELFPN
jgi:hypothetical protein